MLQANVKSTALVREPGSIGGNDRAGAMIEGS